MNDLINRKGAINAVCTVLYPDADKMNDAKKVLKEMPSVQPEYYDYSDIEPLWKSFAEENDINLTDTAKQLKDAMWCGYRKGKTDAQPEPTTDIQEILNYLDTTLHPILSPDNWNVYAELHDMVSKLPSAQPEIIQCENCEHWDGALRNGFYYFEHCSLTGRDCCSYDFCSWAERRTDETN